MYNNNQNIENNPDNLNVYDKTTIPLFKKNLQGPIQGEKVMHADRDELSNKMSDLRLSSFNNQRNNFFQPYTPDLINVESDISHNQIGKKTEFRDTINDRMFQSHPSQLVNNNIPGQIHPNYFHRQQQHIPAEYRNDRDFNSNFQQTNKFNNRDNNNNRMVNLTPLGNNANLHTNQIQGTPRHLIGDTRIGISSNSYLDDNGNLVNTRKKANGYTVPIIPGKGVINENKQHMTQALMDENIMTIGRLPESNQSSRVNFRDKNNERMQNLISLPKTSSLPVVSVYQQQAGNINNQNPINHNNNEKKTKSNVSTHQ